MMNKNYVEERKQLACMLASYVTAEAIIANNNICCAWDSLKVYSDCVKAADRVELILEDNSEFIDTGKIRGWATKWAKDYYEKELANNNNDEYFINTQKKLKDRYWFVEVKDGPLKYIVVLDKTLYETPDYIRQELIIELPNAPTLEDVFDRFKLTRFTIIEPDDVIDIKGYKTIKNFGL